MDAMKPAKAKKKRATKEEPKPFDDRQRAMLDQLREKFDVLSKLAWKTNPAKCRMLRWTLKLSKDELESLCWQSAMETVRKYQDDRHATLATYLASRLQGTLGSAIVSAKRTGMIGKRYVNRNRKWHDEDLGVMYTTDTNRVILQKYRCIATQETIDRLMKIVEKALRKRSLVVLFMRFGISGEQKTLAQIGRALKLSKERVRQIEQEAMRKLRRVFLMTSFEDFVNG